MNTQSRTLTAPQPQQARSKARRLALIEYGATLLNAQDLDDVSIAEITQGLGYSTGSFYSYFADKSALFIAVQTWVAEGQDALIRKSFAETGDADLSLADRLTLSVDVSLYYFRTHTGLIRAALRYERRIPEGWAPNRQLTALTVALATKGLNPADTARLEIALQLAFGLMVNTLLHDPGPLCLHDKDLTPKITNALAPYLAT